MAERVGRPSGRKRSTRASGSAGACSAPPPSARGISPLPWSRARAGADGLMIDPAVPGDLTVAPFAPFLIPEQSLDGAATVRARERNAVARICPDRDSRASRWPPERTSARISVRPARRAASTLW
jgi:hypothetical protein